jgi:two-component system, OmpR family, response regulator
VRLLLIEDEDHLARSLKRGLESEGFAVDIAGDGESGRRQALSGNYDAIVLDILLPTMNGFRVCADLRKAGLWTPILVLTAKEGEFDEAEALDTGADDFLSKPFAFVVLLARLRALLRRAPRARPTTLSAGDLVLDPASHRVWRGTIEVHLTARQFSVLHVLMSANGRALSKQEIIDRVWDEEFRGDPNIVEVYVRHLRKRIDEPFCRRSIETVRFVGYRLDPEGR